jgi:putative transposase
MPNYRRYYCGTVHFFTVVTHKRRPILTVSKARSCLRQAIADCRQRYPFKIQGWVLLPDHLHCIWELSGEDLDYSRRWSMLKRRFTQSFADGQNHHPPFWQKRFWAHQITDDRDYENHSNYIHFNPVKHGYASAPGEWPWTSFHRCVEMGLYSPNWAEGVNIPEKIGRE